MLARCWSEEGGEERRKTKRVEKGKGKYERNERWGERRQRRREGGRRGRKKNQKESKGGGQNVCGSNKLCRPRHEQKLLSWVGEERKEEGKLASVTLGLFLKFGFRCLSPFYSHAKEGREYGREGKDEKQG